MEEKDKMLSYSEMNQSQDDAQTRIYLKSNGPPRDAFEPSAEARQLAQGKSQGEAFLILESSKHGKQNSWIIEEIVGLKGAHRKIHARLEEGDEHFKALDAVATIVTTFRDKWLDRRKVIRNTILGLLTLLLFPVMSVLFAEVLKPTFMRIFGLHP
jgi:hypothetical protein